MRKKIDLFLRFFTSEKNKTTVSIVRIFTFTFDYNAKDIKASNISHKINKIKDSIVININKKEFFFPIKNHKHLTIRL